MQFFYILYSIPYIDKKIILKELRETNVLLKYINSEKPT